MGDETYRTVMNSLHDGVYFVDLDRRIRFWNRAAERLTGFSTREVVGCRCMDNLLNHVDDSGRCLCTTGCPLQASMEDGKPREASVYFRHKDGHRESVQVRTSPIRDSNGAIVGGVEIFNTDDRFIAAMREVSSLKREATRDPLTGLGNRRLMAEKLRSKMTEMRRYGQQFSVLFIDIDHFKRFNDNWGHAVGDRALKTVARTLQHTARTTDDVARWGGEEFVIALGNTGDQEVAAPAERFRSLIGASRVHWQDQDLRVTVSVGAAAARPGETVEQLLTRADEALYRAKAGGRNQIVVAGA
ncbi:MAG: GGDEF domain-containing protein [Acidimicrobiia bacterium]|nr:GGDEF domain-containing protein [Acidimicrobiia bacterium]